ncbi:OmpA family protein [Agrobacterium bohemicum]|uniref:Cell envelope biogenesis protein OmpA n=1 Tax=Agrobacterium bohemicum TaxID=2052828 RepID=A0A135P5V5_9HYPH|nr:OmpA family protein [Agrobacterium bohemicum]KXG86766.1 cell envelope biogenesis protein OmpA [Agrobacterium bohemicum]
MLKKNKLLTGVVFPLMSFAIAIDPAFAASVTGAGASQYSSQQAVTHTGNSQMLLAQAEPTPEELPKKRQQEQQAEPEQPKAEQPKEEAPRPRREAAPEAAPEPKRQPEPKAEPEQPRPRREAAPEGAAEPQKEPQQRPRREAQPDAAPAQAQPEQQQERPRRPKPDAAAQDAAQPEQQKERPRRPKPDQPPAAEEQQKPAADGERPRDPQAKQPAAGEVAPEKPVTPGKKPAAPEPDVKAAPVPTEPPTPGKAPEPKEQPNPAPGQQPSEQQRPPRAQNGEQPPLPTEPKLENGAATGQAPAGEPVPQQVVTPQQEAPPTTKQELDKARAVAKDPSKSADTVILPVDKGAAVLDSDKEAERSGNQQSRDQRRQEREAVQDFKVPTSDAEAQSRRGEKNAPQINIQAITNIQGERINERPEYDRPDGVREWQPRDMPRGGPRDRDMGDRVFLQFGDRVVVRGNDNDRFIRDGAKPYYERLPDDRYRETIERPDGTQVVTVRNRYGDVIQRSRIDSRGREYVLFYAPELVDQPDREYVYRDPGLDLPPMRLRIPVDDYIIDTSSEPDRDYYRFLEQPPVEPVERVYTMDEVRYSARIRDKVRRIDLDTITFATGSAEIPMSQAQSLRKVADAISKVLKNNPAETFLIEGHTDAVGNDESNLVLSDERAASVANVMTDVYGIPPENLTTQGYGERFLKVQTLAASQENRRVTIRRITSLVKPVAQN